MQRSSAAANHGHHPDQKFVVINDPVVVAVERLEKLCAVLSLGASISEQCGELGHCQRLQQHGTKACVRRGAACRLARETGHAAMRDLGTGVAQGWRRRY